MDSYYSYSMNVDDDSGTSYTFIAEKYNRIYTVTFDIYAYQELLDQFPNLLSNGCMLGIFSKSIHSGSLKEDPMVCSTILEIIKDYLAQKGDDAILLYHCETEDKRQAHRSKLFERWFKNYNKENLYIKDNVQVDINIENEKKEYYLGYITSVNNHNIDDVKKEFELFSYNLVSYDINKN